MKRELSELAEQTERKINQLLRILHEQGSDPKLREKLKPDLLALHSADLPRPDRLELEDLRRALSGEKRRLRRLIRELETPRQEPLAVKILGIGEITTTIELKGEGAPRRRRPGDQQWIGLAIKKAPSFPDKNSAENYQTICYEYENFLSRNLEIQTPYAEHRLLPGKDGRWLVYNLQERLPSEAIACLIIQVAAPEMIERVFLRLLLEMRKIFLWNRAHPEYRIGFDGQIPNWAFVRFGPDHPVIEPEEPLLYVDTTTPLIRRHGEEQLDTEIFIKSIPLFLRPIVRRTLLKEVLDRYYRPRDVMLDLIASFITHHRPDLVPRMVELANAWLKDNLSELELPPYTAKEIAAYNRQDVLIWKFFRQMKRMDRFITEKILGKTYEQRLPQGSPRNWENLVGAGGKGLTLPESLRTLSRDRKPGA